MGKHDKKVNGNKNISNKKSVHGKKHSTDNCKTIWLFDKLDRNGPFAFDMSRSDFNHKEILEKIILYSNMTWSDIRKQTHDNNKSKHHFLEMESLSGAALERIRANKLEDFSDSIFSFALQNKLCLIGYRQDEFFHLVWFDPQHEFCPSQKK